MNPILFLFLMLFGGVAFAQDDAAPETEATEDAAPADDAAVEPEKEEVDDAKDGDEKADEEPKAKKDGKAKADLPEVKVPKSDEEAIEDVKKAVEALQTGQWAVFAVLLIGLLVFGWNRFSALKGGGDSEPESK
jgi:hypothetical protein